MTAVDVSSPLMLRSCRHVLSTTPDAWGELRSSDDIQDDFGALRERMEQDGYLYLPSYLDGDQVLDARAALLERLDSEGYLDSGHRRFEAIAGREPKSALRPDLAASVGAIHDLLYGQRMLDFYAAFFESGVRHFDYTWLRIIRPGKGTSPHGDSVFMNRGTPRLLTAWVPLGDISYDLGGLIVLENSHKNDRIRETYAKKDVDSYCENRPHADEWARGEKSWGGYISQNPVKLRERLGGRWLSTEFRAGDLLTFSMFTLHASLDNQTNRLRISSDSRYQPDTEPADERWIGPKPMGHGAAGRRGKIC